MLSIFVMYSPDRLEQLKMTLSCLKDMEGYENCQKTLVVDGKTNIVPEDFAVIQVPRQNDQFCWSYMWEAGVATAQYDKILYLDCDRLLPTDYLVQLSKNIQDDRFVFTSRHFMVLDPEISEEDCKELLIYGFEIFGNAKFARKLKFEPRYKEPFSGPGKNVMSGNTGFTKKTFYELNGVDPWYCGHGAYADTDFHMTAAKNGCKFFDLEVPELHCHHHKLNEKKSPLSEQELYLLSLDNFIYYLCKWGLPKVLAENVAYECQLLENPVDYVEQKFKIFSSKESV